MSLGLNILWFILGGWYFGLMWWLAALVMAISIIGLPWARACFEIGRLNFAPFGYDIISSEQLNGFDGLGPLRLIANILWLPFGLFLCLAHLVHGLVLFVTIIGIPFAVQHFKLAALSLFPVGKRVVPYALADAAREYNARDIMMRWRR